jgi:hypothetical protein
MRGVLRTAVQTFSTRCSCSFVILAAEECIRSIAFWSSDRLGQDIEPCVLSHRPVQAVTKEFLAG